jgi:hypothetical protein
MALTALQQRICRDLADQRKASGESYVAGGGALNELLAGQRRSRDVDLFHDTQAALAASWVKDRAVLAAAGLAVEVVRERPAFVEARIRDGREAALVQWTHDSAFRFFPLLEHPELGLTLHPFDLATNKLLALVGRQEVRDWVDTIHCHEVLQPLGYLAWAAAGKDPGFGPSLLLEEAARATRYTQEEIDALEFQGSPPSAAELSRRWHRALAEGREVVAALPVERAGTCVLDARGELERASPDALREELSAGRVRFHAGRIRGAFPGVRGEGRE